MAKLYFRYGAMGSSKSANILMVRYNYEERGQYAVLLKPRTDNRDGEHEIQSRIGLAAPAEYVDDFMKKSSIVYYSREALEAVHEDIETFAKAERLTAHANSIAVRFEKKED